MNPDISITEKFFIAMGIFDDEEITFQTFDDSEKKDSRLARILHGSFGRCSNRLIELNQRGAGIFWTVNETNLKGRKAENVTRIRAVFVDLDGAPLDPVLKCPCPPNVVVESSPGRYHCYWLVSDCSIDDFVPIQKALIRQFNGDPACFDLPRVMRLPGFIHQKHEPAISVIICT